MLQSLLPRGSLESTDREDLVLDNDQDELIIEIAAANPQTIVVLRTGGPVVMPWLDVSRRSSKRGTRG